MGLAEELRARAARQGRSATIECGALGTVTVEALPVRELELMFRGPDGQRAVFYAACRELQAAGEELRKAGQVFAPDGIMQFVSNSEAAAAAQTVLELSGQPDFSAKTENQLESVHEFVQQIPEVRQDIVQEQVVSSAEPQAERENQLTTVQETVQQLSEIRPVTVQFPETAPAAGQVSREFSPNGDSGWVTPSEGTVSDFEQQNPALPEKNDGFMLSFEVSGDHGKVPGQMEGMNEIKSEFGEGQQETTSGFQDGNRESLHETTSEFQGGNWESPHETTSEFQGGNRESLHETTLGFQGGTEETMYEIMSKSTDAPHETMPEYRYGLQETKSDFDGIRRNSPHKTTSDFNEALHETTSDFQQGLHEMTSEFPKKDRAALHETTSELAEAVVRRLVEGLQRAKWVRGD